MKVLCTTCDRCGQPIERWRDLVVWCDSAKAHDALRRWEAENRKMEQQAEHTAKDWAGFLRPLSSVPVLDTVQWNTFHYDCITDEEWLWGYPIEGARINTLGKALAWTLHLQEKVWYEATDWQGLIRRLFKLPTP